MAILKPAVSNRCLMWVNPTRRVDSRCVLLSILSLLSVLGAIFSHRLVFVHPQKITPFGDISAGSPRGPAGSSSRWAAARTTLPAPQAQLGEVRVSDAAEFFESMDCGCGFGKILASPKKFLKRLPHFCTNTDYSFQSNRAFSSSFFTIELLSTHLNSMMQYSHRMMQYDLFCQVCYSSWILSLSLVLHTRPNRSVYAIGVCCVCSLLVSFGSFRKCCRCQRPCWNSTMAALVSWAPGDRHLCCAAINASRIPWMSWQSFYV